MEKKDNKGTVILTPFIYCILASIFIAPIHATAASKADIDKLTTYAVILGRAVACGNDIKGPMRRVGRWMDKRFPPGSVDQQTYLPIFMQGVTYHAQLQKEGQSPDSCSAVNKSFSKFPWP